MIKMYWSRYDRNCIYIINIVNKSFQLVLLSRENKNAIDKRSNNVVKNIYLLYAAISD